MDVVHFSKNDPEYPPLLAQHLSDQAPEKFAALGNINILKCKKMALFCSVKCPGNLILQTYDLARNLRQSGVTVISGFHSPMERECLTILLRGKQPIIVCPARVIQGMRLRKEFGQPLSADRVVCLSPVSKDQHRISKETAVIRNRFVAAVADSIFVSYAASGSKMEQLCKEILVWQKQLYVLEDAANHNLISSGAIPVGPDIDIFVTGK